MTTKPYPGNLLSREPFNLRDTSFQVFGSHGELEVDARTGFVLNWYFSACESGDDGYQNILRFDMEEFAAYRTSIQRPFTNVDILSIGYWYINDLGKIDYEPPVAEHRVAAIGSQTIIMSDAVEPLMSEALVKHIKQRRSNYLEEM